MPTPLAQLWDGTMALHDYLQERLGGTRSPFFIPVLLLPDMEPDPAIEAWAEHTHVHVVFGTDALVERLIDLAPHTRLLYPPTAEEIAEEVALVLPGGTETPPAPADVQFKAEHVTIQHADRVIIYTTGGGDGV